MLRKALLQVTRNAIGGIFGEAATVDVPAEGYTQSISDSSGVSITIPDGAGDAYIGFNTTDAAEMIYMPEGTEVVGPPSGATSITIKPIGSTTQVEIDNGFALPRYGGDPGQMVWASNSNVAGYEFDLAKSPTQPFTILTRCKLKDVLSTGSFYVVSVYDNAQVSTANIVALRQNNSSPDTLQGHVKDSTGSERSSGISMDDDEWSVVAITLTGDANNKVQCKVWSETSGERLIQSAALTSHVFNAFTKLCIGALPDGAGNGGIQGSVAEVLVYDDAISDAEFTTLRSGTEPFAQLVPDPALIVAIVTAQSTHQWRDWVGDTDGTLVFGLSSNVAFNTVDTFGIGAARMKVPNRLAANASQVQEAYTETDSGLVVTSANASPNGMWRAQMHYDIRSEYGSAPDPDALPYLDRTAGVRLFGGGQIAGYGHAFKTTESGESGTLDLRPLEYAD